MENYIITVDGVSYEVTVEKKGQGSTHIAQNAPAAQAAPKAASTTSGTPVTTGTAGKVWKIAAKVGDQVKRGDTVLILEAMKMEIPVVSPVDGKLTGINVNEGDSVETGATVATVE